MREVVDRLDLLIAEFRLLRAAIEGRSRGGSQNMTSADRRRLEGLVPVIEAQLGREFEVSQVLDAAGLDDVRGTDMRLVLGDLSAPRLGKLLRRGLVTGETFSGYRIERRSAGPWGLTRVDPVPLPFSGDSLAGRVKAFDRRRTR